MIGAWRLKTLMDYDTTMEIKRTPTRSMMIDALGQHINISNSDFWNLRYIDDGLAGEILHNFLGQSSITMKKERRTDSPCRTI